MKKTITTSVLSIVLMGAAQAFALTGAPAPTSVPAPMTPPMKEGAKTGTPLSRDEYVKKALADGKITQAQADMLAKKGQAEPTPKTGGKAPTGGMMKADMPVKATMPVKTDIKETTATKPVMEKPHTGATVKAAHTTDKKVMTGVKGKMKPAPAQVPGATVAQ